MLIRIPETPGIPAVLREIAALCPRHFSTAEQHGYSLSSPPARAPASWPSDRPTARLTRACEDTCARDICTGWTKRFADDHAYAHTHTFSFSTSVCPMTVSAPYAAVDFSRWKGRLAVAWDISVTLYSVQGAFPWRNAAMISLENGNVGDLIKSRKNYSESW